MKTLKDKIKNLGMGFGLAGILAMNGCETPTQYATVGKPLTILQAPDGWTPPSTKEKKFDSNEFFDNLYRFVLGGGVISHLLGDNAASKGNLEQARALHAIGSLQDANYQRQNMIDAAREGKSEVNINLLTNEAQQNNINPLPSNLSQYLKIETYLWKDGYGGGKIDENVEFEEIIKTNKFYLDEISFSTIQNNSTKNIPFPVKISIKNEKNEVVLENVAEIPAETTIGLIYSLESSKLMECGAYTNFTHTNYFVDYFLNTPNSDIPLARKIIEFRKKENENEIKKENDGQNKKYEKNNEKEI